MLPEPTREQLIGLLITHPRMNDHVGAILPINRCRDLMFISQLKRVDNAKDLIERTSDLSRVRHGETNDLFGVDDKDGSNGEGLTFRIDVCGVDGIEHVIQGGNLAIRVRDLLTR